MKEEEGPYQLLKTFLPRVRLLVLFWVYLVELPRLGVHHGARVFKHFHVKLLPEMRSTPFYHLCQNFSVHNTEALLK